MIATKTVEKKKTGGITSNGGPDFGRCHLGGKRGRNAGRREGASNLLLLRRPVAEAVRPFGMPLSLLFVLLALLLRPIVYERKTWPAGDNCGGAPPMAITALGAEAFRLGLGCGGGWHPRTDLHDAAFVGAESRSRGRRPCVGGVGASSSVAIGRGIPTFLAPPLRGPATWSRLGVTGVGRDGDGDGETGAMPSDPNATGDMGHDGGEGPRPSTPIEVGVDVSSSLPTPVVEGDDDGETTKQPMRNDNKKKRKRRRFIPPEEVERIKSEVDIVEFVEHYADPPLERFTRTSGGRRATAICPFHDDTNPSLNVDSERGLYGCFACGAAGDVFNFVREYDLVTGGGGGSKEGVREKMGFREAVEVVMDYVEMSGGGGGSGVKWTPSPTSNSRKRKKALVSEKKKKRILLANAAAAAFYHRNLVSLPGAGAARTHLRERGLRPSTVKAFFLGYAPDAYFGPGSRGWTRTRVDGGDGGGVKGSLVQHLRGLGFTPDEIVDSGLATRTAGRGRKGGDGKVGANATLAMLDDRMNHTDGTASALAEGEYVGVSQAPENITASTRGGRAEDTQRKKGETLHYDELMDRFRNRLIVPIFDEDGASVVALGGRHLEGPAEPKTTVTPPSASTTQATDHGGGGGAFVDHPPPPSWEERMIESEAMTEKVFRPAKYINSPESAVFSKKQCLFGMHMARASLGSGAGSGGAVNDAHEGMDVYHPSPSATVAIPEEKGANVADDEWSSRRECERRLVIVEGYLDAVVLHDAGVSETVACMGTALSAEQLTLAAEAVVGGDGYAGAIILCLDGDQAGIMAMERVCESMVVSEVLDKFEGLEIMVASMPEGVKDPAEFIDIGSSHKADHTSDADAGYAFRREILDRAMQWSDWYLLRLVARYEDDCTTNDAANNRDSSADGAHLADVCEDVSEFISTFDDPSGRVRHASQAAHALVMKFIGRDGATDGSPSPSALRIQLESNILDLSVRKARGKALARKIESASREKGKNLSGRGKAEIMSKLTRGESTGGDDPTEFEPIQKLGNRDAEDGLPSQRSSSKGAFVRWSKREKRSAAPRPALVPHFSGFEFANPTDVHWLGLESEQGGLLLGMNNGKRRLTKNQGDAFKSGDKIQIQRGRTVYFNSNEYLGCNDETVHFDLGVPGLTEDPKRILLASEERLLRHLVEHSPARKAMKAALTMSLKSNIKNTSDFIEWSSPEREWLFHCLVDVDHRHSPLPEELRDGGTVMQLREHLSARQDAPIGAFCRNLTANSHHEISTLRIDASPAALDVDDMLNASTGAPTPHDAIEDFPEDARVMAVNELGENDSTIHAEVVTVDEVYSSKVQRGRVPNGTLEMFFFRQQEDDDDFFHLPDAAMARDMRADLVVQETLATILRARAATRMHEMKTHWHDAKRDSLTRAEAGKDVDRNGAEDVDTMVSTELNQKVGRGTMLESMDVEQLDDHCDRLGTELCEATRTTRELKDASRRMGSRFLDYSSYGGISFAHSVAKEEELAKMVDEFVADLPEDTHIPDSPGGDGRYIFGSDEYDDFINPLYGGRRSDDVAFEEDDEHEPTQSFAEEDGLPEDSLVEMIKRGTPSGGASPPKFDDNDEQRSRECATTTSSAEEEEMARLLDDYISGLPEDALGSDDDEEDDIVEASDREQQQHRFERVIRARRAKESQTGSRKPGRGWAWTASGWAWNPLSFDHVPLDEEENAEDTP